MSEVPKMISMGDLKTNAKMRLVLAIDTETGYQNQYVSDTYPRLAVVKTGKSGFHTNTYFVDNVECADLDMVVNMLNTEPHPQRTDLDQHQKDLDQ
jgi:hypothetical protein